MKARYRSFYKSFNLHFHQPAKTSRNTLVSKTSYFLIIRDLEKNITGIGECSLIPGLSIDNENQIPDILEKTTGKIDFMEEPELNICPVEFPAVRFGLETAFTDLNGGGKRTLFETSFLKGKSGIPINGLVWMADLETMKKQVVKKIEEGFACIKLKIGSFRFEDELELLRFIRKEYPPEIEIRLDANGAYSYDEAVKNLEILSDFNIHSVEQPIPAGRWDEMAALCEKSPVAIALDEELIGIHEISRKLRLLETIRPQYLILKPSLIGGFRSAEEWIRLVEETNTGWWVTSALESNIGLNAISQWVSTKETVLPQGLGTGLIYNNNFPSPLTVEKGRLHYDPGKNWETGKLFE